MSFKKLFKFYKKPTNIFFELLIEQSKKTLQGVKALESFMESSDEKSAIEVEALEKDADETRHLLIEKINKSFVTPIDREDIFTLSRAVDDILDYCYSTVDEMGILNIQPNAYLRSMVVVLGEATEQIYLAVQQLGKQSQAILEHATRAKKLENRVEGLYRKALSELFKGADEVSEVLDILKMREIYRHVSNAADRVDEAANVLSDIAVKIT